MLPSRACDDVRLTAALAELINEVYAVAEEGLWVAGTPRTTADEVAGLVGNGQVAIARASGRIIGCVRVQRLGQGVGEFGMLAVLPAYRGTGLGRDLVSFAEREAGDQGCGTMQLEILVPRTWSHPSKDFLMSWYARIGYRRHRVGAIEESHPHLAPHLATACDFVIYRKDLAAQPA